MTVHFHPRHERKISVNADANTEMSSDRSRKSATASTSAAPPQLWLAVHFPLLELDVFLPYWQRRREDHGSVVLQQNRVTAMSETAQQAGIRTGMRRGGVLMLLPTAKLFQRDLLRQKNTLEAAAIALLRYTPQVAIAEEATIVLDIGASLRLFGGLRALRQHVRQTMEILGLHTTIACAPFAKAACILARDAARRHKSGAQCLHPQRLPARLHALPVSLLTCPSLSGIIARAGMSHTFSSATIATRWCATPFWQSPAG
jgi:protein ImuB